MSTPNGEGMLVGEPNDGVERAQRADALWRAEEFLVVGKPEFEFSGGETSFSQ